MKHAPGMAAGFHQSAEPQQPVVKKESTGIKAGKIIFTLIAGSFQCL